MRYAFIQRYRETFAYLSRMCAVMRVSRSGYYEWCNRPESHRDREDRRLGEKVETFHNDSRRTYGQRRIQKDLADDGEKLSRSRIGRLMRQQGFEVKTKRRFRATTNSNHNLPVATNLLAREFKVEHPDTVYVGDITYIATA